MPAVTRRSGIAVLPGYWGRSFYLTPSKGLKIDMGNEFYGTFSKGLKIMVK